MRKHYDGSGLPTHGSAEDRGGADKAYNRPRRPHYFTGGTYHSTEVSAQDMTPEEIAMYNKGYNSREAGDR